jgi:hypothetical protein
MFKTMFTTAIMTFALTATAIAGTRDVYKHGKIFQNVKAEHIQPLFNGSAFVAHLDYEGLGNTKSGGDIQIFWFSKNKKYSCYGYPNTGGLHQVYISKYDGVMHHSKYLRADYPLIATWSAEGNANRRSLIRYEASTGNFTQYWYEKLKWWETITGHLQSELPAVTWELCPDFPSAKSLGARVNKKQTAKFYNDLVAQDAGKRVRKPQYEAKEETVIWYGLEGGIQNPKKN